MAKLVFMSEQEQALKEINNSLAILADLRKMDELQSVEPVKLRIAGMDGEKRKAISVNIPYDVISLSVKGYQKKLRSAITLKAKQYSVSLDESEMELLSGKTKKKDEKKDETEDSLAETKDSFVETKDTENMDSTENSAAMEDNGDNTENEQNEDADTVADIFDEDGSENQTASDEEQTAEQQSAAGVTDYSRTYNSYGY